MLSFTKNAFNSDIVISYHHQTKNLFAPYYDFFSYFISLLLSFLFSFPRLRKLYTCNHLAMIQPLPSPVPGWIFASVQRDDVIIANIPYSAEIPAFFFRFGCSPTHNLSPIKEVFYTVLSTTSCIRLFAISQNVVSISAPKNCLPFCAATRQCAPLPAQGSNTTSPSFVLSSRMSLSSL